MMSAFADDTFGLRLRCDAMNKQIDKPCLVGIVLVAAMLTFIPTQPTQAGFCACCVEPGTWYEESRQVYDYEFRIINQLKIYRVARLYVPVSFADGFKGISAVGDEALTEDYDVSVSQQGQRWTLAFKRKDGKRGSLLFTLPKTAVRFGADLNANLRTEPRDPQSIYKEMRFKGAVWGTGMFAVGNARGTTFLLTLQGYGNACMDESDFRNWTLAVSGPRASYRFYGGFVTSTR
jgi:hypothetical protein